MRHEPKRSFRNGTKIPLPRGLTEPARAKFMAALDAHQTAIDALLAFLDEADGDAEAEEVEPLEDDNEDCCSAHDDCGGDPNPSWAHPDDDPYGDEKEHSLGWTGGMNQEHALKQISGNIDTNSDREADDADTEPSLGSKNPDIPSAEGLVFADANCLRRMTGQENWAFGGTDDREDECEDEGSEELPSTEFSPACPTLAKRQD